MTNDNENPAAELRSLVDGFQLSQALHVAATLGIADALANGARTSDELAAESGANADALYRLLRALAAAGVFRERDDRRFELTPIGDRLRVDADESIAAWAVWIGQPSYWEAWGSLLHSVRTGENAFRHIHGTDVWVYRSTHPELSATFDRAMAGNARRTNTDLLASYDFSPFDTIVDVGGGTGAFLGAVLAATPSARGVLFDQTHVVAAASAVLDRLGVGDRCEIVGGSFFESVPPGADAYLIRAVLHDWEDDEVTRILEAVRRAMPDNGTLLVVERVVGAPNTGRATKFSDLNMLVSPGGRERTVDEYATLLQRSRFELTRVVPGGMFSYVEGRPTA